MRAKRSRHSQGEDHSLTTEEEPPGSRKARRRWTALIQRVFEVDPLTDPKCSGTMRVVGFIGRNQGDTIEQILRHCGLWDPPPAVEGEPAPGLSAEPGFDLDPE